MNPDCKAHVCGINCCSECCTFDPETGGEKHITTCPTCRTLGYVCPWHVAEPNHPDVPVEKGFGNE